MGSEKHCFFNMILSTVIHVTKTWQINSMSLFFWLLFPNAFKFRKTCFFQYVPKHCNSCYQNLTNQLNKPICSAHCFRTHLGKEKHRFFNMFLSTENHAPKLDKLKQRASFCGYCFQTHLGSGKTLIFQYVPKHCKSCYQKLTT